LPGTASPATIAANMPVELTVFTADRRIQGAVPLADDRLSDMLNSVPRIIIRAAQVRDLVNGGPPEVSDVTISAGSIIAVLTTGRRGLEARRLRTDLHPARVGLIRYVVSGWLHVPVGNRADLDTDQPHVALAGRDMLVPLTDASITYEGPDETVTERIETILVNRSHATWIDLDERAADGESVLIGETPIVYHAAPPKHGSGIR
jgi:hypothetical protein